MSYRCASKSTYAQRRIRKQLPSLNYAFRSAWESNIDRALARIEELKTQGWTVDMEQGALTANQADLIAGEAERMGCEVERIPVAEWVGDLAQFVAYRRKEGSETPPIIPKPQPQPQRRVVQAVLTPEQVMDAYVKEFFDKRYPPDPDEVKAGFLMDPGRVAALIRRDAQAAGSSFIENARKLIPTAPFEDIDNTTKTQQALSRAKKLDPPKTRITLVGQDYNLDVFVKALKVLGKGRLRVHVQKDGPGPVYVVNSQGDIIAIAPVIEASDSEKIAYKDAMALPKVIVKSGVI